MTPRHRPLRAAFRLVGFLLMNIVVAGAYAACVGPLRRFRWPVRVVWCRCARWLAGLRVQTIGQQSRGGPVLFVSNHVSYLDIPVLCGEMEATFVAKADVRHWPVFGLIARLTRTVFIDRRGLQAMEQQQVLLHRLVQGESLTLFPEGTSTDGSSVLPFKSSLFSIAERLPAGFTLTIQPVSISYARYADGTPLTGERRALYCWFGDLTMAPHLWHMLGLAGCEVEVRFGDPITIAERTDRKQLAQRAQAAVARGVALSHGVSGDAAPRQVEAQAGNGTVAATEAPFATAAGRYRSAPSSH